MLGMLKGLLPSIALACASRATLWRTLAIMHAQVIPDHTHVGAFSLPGEHASHSTYNIEVPEATTELFLNCDVLSVICTKVSVIV